MKRLHNGFFDKITTRSNNADLFTKDSMAKFVIAMDNYFTKPSVMKRLRDMNIGVVGTSQMQKNWPPKALRDVQKETSSFNDFYYDVDEYGTLVGRWMDNNFVLCVSTVHKVGQVIKRERRRPRLTDTNKNHVNKIWGNAGKQAIYIPVLIDDYNQLMGGVDVCDQRIAYYHPDLHCNRIWIPMFMQTMSIIRNNSYVVYRTNNDKPMTQKHFVMKMIKALMKKAHYHTLNPQDTHSRDTREIQSMKRRLQTEAAVRAKQPKKLKQKPSINDFPMRFHRPLKCHVAVQYNGCRGTCVVCRDLWKKGKKERKDEIVRRELNKLDTSSLQWHKANKRIKQVCHYCTTKDLVCYLCDEHFNMFHQH